MATKTHEFKMEMTCEGCSGAAKRVLGKIGVSPENIDADLNTKIVTVTSTVPEDELLEALKKTGKEISYIGEKK